MKMREILFRGKTPGGKWVEGIYSPYNWDIDLVRENKPQIIILSENKDDIDGLWCDIIPETVGQYTGHTDKNGTKIFEGDIVKILDFQTGIIINECATFGVGISPFIDWDYIDSKIHTITGCDNNPHFCQNDNFCSLWELMWNYNQEGNDCSVVEVIGNIHDNPEMLNAAANERR